MSALLASLVFLTAVSGASDANLRVAVAETALMQAKKIDPAWHPDQRDCAGLVRFSYRSAYRKLRPERLSRPLFLDSKGALVDFADAKTLVGSSFVSLGRQQPEGLESGDLVAYKLPPDETGESQFHLMLVVRTRGHRGGDVLVVYHPGARGESVRVGPLEELLRAAPHEWRPVPENKNFIGFFRFKEWAE